MVISAQTDIMSDQRGFTLFEVLIAFFIFSIIVTTVYTSINSVLANVKAVDEGIDRYEMGSNCMNRIILDLQSIHVAFPPEYQVPDIDDPVDPFQVVGKTDYSGGASFSELRFTSLAHVPLEAIKREGIARVVYYVGNPEEERHVLYRSDRLYPYPEFEPDAGDPILCDDVKSFTVTYTDDEGTEHEYWDSESDEFEHGTPEIITVKLEIGDENSSLLFKTMISLSVYREKMSS